MIAKPYLSTAWPAVESLTCLFIQYNQDNLSCFHTLACPLQLLPHLL